MLFLRYNNSWGDTVTIEDLKKLDKQIREISDPFGEGFPAVRKIVEEWAEESGLSVHDLVEQYVAWKWRK